MAHTALSGSAEVAGNEALHADLLRGVNDVLLGFDGGRDDRADDDVDAGEDLLQLRDAVGEVAETDLDAGRAECLGVRLGMRGGADECRNALYNEGVSMWSLHTSRE